MANIYVLGSINMDLVFALKRLPERGETVESEKFFFSPGGKGANQAVAAAKQKVSTFMIGSVGSDALSSDLKKALHSQGVDCRYLEEYDDEHCGVAGIFLEDGDNRIVIDAGANRCHDMENMKQALSGSKAGDYLAAQLEVPIEVVEEAFSHAKRVGMKTVLNAAPAKLLPEVLYRHVDLLVLNEVEAKTLTGIALEANKGQDAANALMEKGAGAVLLTLGKKGSVYFDRKGRLDMAAYAVRTVDTTAAGDAYIGALIAALAQNATMEAAMRLASATAALTVQSYGAQEAIPSKEEVEAFLKAHTTIKETR